MWNSEEGALYVLVLILVIYKRFRTKNKNKKYKDSLTCHVGNRKTKLSAIYKMLPPSKSWNRLSNCREIKMWLFILVLGRDWYQDIENLVKTILTYSFWYILWVMPYFSLFIFLSTIFQIILMKGYSDSTHDQ